MKIMGYNILEGGLGRIDPIAEVIRAEDPDVLVLAEAGDRDLFNKLADRLGMDGFLAEPAHHNPAAPPTGVGLLTKSTWEIREAVNYAPLDPRLTRSALSAVLRSAGKEFGIVGAYLHARETLADEALRMPEIAAVLDIAQRFRDKATNFAIVGDFNAHHPDQIIDLAQTRKNTLDRIAPQGNLIPRQAIAALLQTGYLDAHAIHHSPTDFGVSLTTSAPTLRVDYVFVPPYLKDRVKRCWYPAGELAKYASDHFPVVAEIEES